MEIAAIYSVMESNEVLKLEFLMKFTKLTRNY